MTKFEEYQEHIQYTHNAFCRIVIRHASIDAARKLYSTWKREIIFLYFFEHLTHAEIGKRYGRTRSTAGRHIYLDLRRLREEMEVLVYKYGHQKSNGL